MRALCVAVGLLAASCGNSHNDVVATGLEGLALTELQPRTIVPGTQLRLKGNAFLDAPLGRSSLHLVGSYAGAPIDALLPAQFVDYDEMSVTMSAQTIALLGAPTGEFTGQISAHVVFTPEGSTHESIPLNIGLSLNEELVPELDSVQSGGTIFVNDKIEVEGSGLLFGGDEGRTVAVVEGCFTPDGESECLPVGPTPVDVTPSDPDSRDDGTFPFSPEIAGIFPGSFDGTVYLENRHEGGSTTESDPEDLSFTVAPTTIGDVGGGGGSLGQFIDIPGGGFVGGDEGLTILRLMGDYIPDDGVDAIPVPGLELIPEFVDGTLVRYIVNEEDPLGQAIDLRSDTGTFDGFIQPVVVFGSDEYEGVQTPATFKILPVKQVVWVKFAPSYVESLRKFGLRAMDAQIRERIIAVMERDYETINIEFRTEQPEDFALYSEIEIAGPDPNGLGLLGYDNTPGKDYNNERLFDRIGGVNALTQEDGFPGFGGVFIESLFTYSPNPPDGYPSEVAVPIFDQIFDPARPDRGTPVTGVDLATVPQLDSGGACPAAERRLQVACAVWTLGSVVGSTVSHEVGHSLGLADPLGERFHNLGDAPNRLMDQGGNRTFEERAELMGEGPSSYCVEAYQYLRDILPTDEDELLDGREHC